MTSAATSPARIAGNSLIDLIRADSRIRFFPLIIRRVKRDDYNVIRVGCSTITVIATRQAGVEAIKLLKKGLSPEETRDQIGARHGCLSDHINLTPLVYSLLNARMIRKIDDKTIISERPKWLRVLYHHWKRCLVAIRLATTAATFKYLPVGLAFRIQFYLHWWRGRQKLEQLRSDVRENLRRALGHVFSESRIDDLAADYVREHVRRAVDARSLGEMSPAKVVRWLKTSAEFAGLENIESARLLGKGAILCGFHFSSQFLLSLILWQRGYCITVIGLMGRLSDEEQFRAYYKAFKEENPGSSSLKWFTALDLRSVSHIRKALSRGEIVMIFADAYSPAVRHENKILANYFGNTIAGYHPARSAVKFLGQTIAGNKGVAWLHLQTGAPILPVRLLRRHKISEYDVIIEPPLDLGGTGDVDEATAAIYQTLEQYIHKNPAQWCYWKTLQSLAIPAEAPSGVV